jgi:hypothetical protein
MPADFFSFFFYCKHKLESTSYICIASDNNHNVDIADSHIKEKATTNLPHRTRTKFFGLHYMHLESINHTLWTSKKITLIP